MDSGCTRAQTFPSTGSSMKCDTCSTRSATHKREKTAGRSIRPQATHLRSSGPVIALSQRRPVPYYSDMCEICAAEEYHCAWVAIDSEWEPLFLLAFYVFTSLICVYCTHTWLIGMCMYYETVRETSTSLLRLSRLQSSL